MLSGDLNGGKKNPKKGDPGRADSLSYIVKANIVKQLQ